MIRASASTTIAAPPADVFAFLGDLGNHWRLAERYVTILDVADGGPDGAWVRVSAPLRQTRRARTRVAQAVAPEDGVGGVVEGTASTSGGTEVRVGWRLSPYPEGTRVVLELLVEKAARLDRLLLTLGGRLWLERRFLPAALDDLGWALQRR